MTPQEKELHTSILELLKTKDSEEIVAGLELLSELSSLWTDKKQLDSLYSSVFAQLASLWVSSGNREGFAILYHLCLQDLTAKIWGAPFDRGCRDRHLGLVLDRHQNEFTGWVEKLGVGQAISPPSIVLDRFPICSLSEKEDPNHLLLLVGGLKNYGAYATPEEDSFALGRVGRIAVLLQLGGASIVDTRYNYNQTTILHHLATLGDVKSIQYVVSMGADINALDKHGQTPLFWAAKERTGAWAIRSLVELGADVNVTAKDGRTALFTCAYSGTARIATALMELGADPNANVANVLTPVAMAARSGNLATARALVEGGAIITDHAVEEAKQSDRFNVVAYFDSVLGTPKIAANEARSMMEAVATTLGAKAGISAVESGDYHEYCEDDSENLLAGQYWEAHYLDLVNEKIATLSEAAQTELSGQEDLMGVLQALYDAAFTAAV